MRYFFHLHECGTETPDTQGEDCADIGSVRRYALKAAREVMCAELAEGRLCLSCHIRVTDEAGTEALFLPFSDAVTISEEATA